MRTVFYCFGAYVGQLTGTTQVSWWPDDPVATGFPQQRLIPIDLAKNPTAARAGTIQIQDIQVDDDRANGGLTSVGPRFPGGQMIGAMWVAETYLKTLGANQPSASSADAYDYELMATLYWKELGDRRFNGFHAEIVAPPQGNLVLVDIWNGGTAKSGAKPAGRWWLDLDAVSDPNYTTISAKGPQSGALFLDRQTSSQLQLFYIKRPAGLGFDAFPLTE
jgi:hypothetical protein